MLFYLVQAIPFSFAALFPVLNPFGTAIIFLTLTMGASQKKRKELAFTIAINTIILLTIVLLTGSWVLRFFGITIPIVEVGGGIVLAHIGWSLLNTPAVEDKNDSNPINDNEKLSTMAFYPLTLPLTAGPGAIAVTLAVTAHQVNPVFTNTVMGELGCIAGIILSAVIVYICYAYAGNLVRKLGEAGMQVIVRLSAFLTLCIGLEILWRGIQELLH